MEKKEKEVLLYFLKSRYSARQLDELLGFSVGSKGWVSWNILKKYKLKDQDKGKLFLYSSTQCNKIIKLLMVEKKEGYIDILIKENLPSKLKKYENTYVISDSEKSFYNILAGETRNIIRDFFTPQKRLIGKCQFNGCNKKTTLETAHFSKDRPQIFKESAKIHKKRFKNKLFKFDVYKTMKSFLEGHSKKKSVCFLCKKHHNEFHVKEKGTKIELKVFKKKILFD